MGIPDDVWNNTIRSVWPATESMIRVNVLAMGSQCGGFYDFAGVINGTPDVFVNLQQLEIQAAEYVDRVKEAYIPTSGDFVLAKYEGIDRSCTPWVSEIIDHRYALMQMPDLRCRHAS